MILLIQKIFHSSNTFVHIWVAFKKSFALCKYYWHFVLNSDLWKLIKQEGHDGPGSLTWENINQMLNVAIYMIKIWPSELLFYPASSSGDKFLAFYLALQEQEHEV